MRPRFIRFLAFFQFILFPLLLGGAASLLMSGLNEQDATLIVFACIVALLGLLSLICGLGLWKIQNYGRLIQIFLACLGLLAFPLGTIVSIAILWHLTRPEIKLLFSRKQADELTAEESELLATVNESTGRGVLRAFGASGVVAALLIGLVVFFLIPNTTGVISRSTQKRTMADMRSIGTACEAYAVDNNFYPSAETIDELATFVEPLYIKNLPRTDAWNHKFYYRAGENSELGPQSYTIVSAGKDGVLENAALQYKEKQTSSYDSDIVFSLGIFVQYPEGIQQ